MAAGLAALRCSFLRLGVALWPWIALEVASCSLQLGRVGEGAGVAGGSVGDEAGGGKGEGDEPAGWGGRVGAAVSM